MFSAKQHNGAACPPSSLYRPPYTAAATLNGSTASFTLCDVRGPTMWPDRRLDFERDAQILHSSPASPGHLEHHAPLECHGAKFRERYLEFTCVPTVYRGYMADSPAGTSDDELLSDADDASSTTSHEKSSGGQGVQSKHQVRDYDAKWTRRFPWIRFTLLYFLSGENTAIVYVRYASKKT